MVLNQDKQLTCEKETWALPFTWRSQAAPTSLKKLLGWTEEGTA